MASTTSGKGNVHRAMGMRAAALAMMLALVAGCSGSGSDGTAPSVASGVGVAGQVQAPNGQLAKAPMTGKQWFASLFRVAESWAIDIAGWTGVSGATVRVFTIDNDGAPNGPVIATGSTNPDGSFNLTLPTGTAFASNLVAQIENDLGITTPQLVGTTNTLTVSIVSGTVNVNPATNAATVALVNRPEPLSDFTPTEVAQYLSVVETLVTEDPPVAIDLAGILAEIVADFSSQMTAALNALSGTGAAPLTILPTTFPTGVINSVYSKTAVAVGGTGTLTWNLDAQNGPLPLGLGLNAATGVVSGTPLAPASFPFTLRVQDAASPTPNSAQRGFSILVTGDVAPAITQHPFGTTVSVGQTASFQAFVSGAPVPTLQWQRSVDGGGTWSDIAGATASMYTTPATQLSDSGHRFRMIATNSLNSATSNAALLTVNPVSVIQRELRVLNSGSDAFLIRGGSVKDDQGKIDCSWFKNTNANCRALYPDGSSVTMTATPWPNYRMFRWTFFCQPFGTALSGSITLAFNEQCLPQFEIIPGSTFTLTVTTNPWVNWVVQVAGFNDQVVDNPIISCGPLVNPQVCSGGVVTGSGITVKAFPISGAPAGAFHWSCTTLHPDDPINGTPLVVNFIGTVWNSGEMLGNTSCFVELVPTLP